MLVVESDKFTVPLYLAIEVSFIVEPWVDPARTIKLDGFAEMLKFGFVATTVGVCAIANSLPGLVTSKVSATNIDKARIVLVFAEV